MMEQVTDMADPGRCRGPSPEGQCRNRAVEGQNYCPLHGGRTSLAEKAEVKTFLLAKAEDRARLAELSQDLDPVKALNEVLTLNLILINKRWNECRSNTDLVLNCGSLNTLMLTTERLVTSMNKLQKDLGSLLSKQALVNFGKALVQILIEELDHIDGYEVIVDNICSRLFNTIDDTSNRNTGGVIEAHIALPSPRPDPPL